MAPAPDRLARFEREAQLLAALNHPNIATIHGLEDGDGIRALVLEVVDGPTLEERLRQGGAIPIGESIRLARQLVARQQPARHQLEPERHLRPVREIGDGRRRREAVAGVA